MSDITLEVQSREETGKNANRRLRATGLIPAVVYGGDLDPVAIQVDRRTLHDLFKQTGGENAVFLLKLAGTDQKRHSMVRELTIDPITRQVIHIDFLRVLMTEKVKVQEPINLEGTPVGVKNEGGVLDFITREVEVECLPGDIPQTLELDVSDLEIGSHREVKDLEVPAGVELMVELDKVIVAVAHSRVATEVEEAEAEAAEAGLLEAEEVEPELIGRAAEDEAEEED
ncbi:MAG: 50S ribosomal protein L25 [Thermoanaerobaculia bacterium]